MRQRLFCLVAIKLSKHTIDELKELYDIPNLEINKKQIKLTVPDFIFEEIKKKSDIENAKIPDFR